MNISQLQPPPSPHLNRLFIEAPESDAKFLSFKLLNKRARVRLSTTPFKEGLPPSAHLFAVANSIGWFTAVSRQSDADFTLVFSPLSDLRASFYIADQGEEISFNPKRALVVPQTPAIIKFANRDTRLVLCLANGEILLYDTSGLFTPGPTIDRGPIHSWPSSAPSIVRQILPNPGDMPEQVAILRDGNPSKVVEVIDVQKLESIGGWRSSDTSIPTALTWSPKGKQLGIGLQSGDILTFCPTETATPKLQIPAPPFSTPHTIQSVTWLSNPTFHVIYASISNADPTHVVVTLDGKSSSTENVKFAPPNFLLAGSTPNAFTLAMKNWDPAKLILVVGDSASPDLGIIGNLDGKWCNIYLEETDTPRMPLDKNGDETVIAALELDLTNDRPLNVNIDGDDLQIPPPPIMYVFTSDGTAQGWNVVNAKGVQYPGSVDLPFFPRPSVLAFPSDRESPDTIAGTLVASMSVGSDISPSRNTATGEESQRMSGRHSILESDLRSNVTVGHALGRSSTSDQRTALTFGGQPNSPIFGQPSFGQSPALSKSIAFDVNTTSTLSTGAVPFGAFASATFSQPSIDRGSALSPHVQTLSQVPAEDMSLDDSAPPPESLSLGEHPKDTPRNSQLAIPIASVPPQNIQAKQRFTGTQDSDPAVSGVIKPAIGFGALGPLSGPLSKSDSGVSVSRIGGVSVLDDPVIPTSSSSPDSSPRSTLSSPLGPETSGSLPFAPAFKSSASLRKRESSEPRISNSGSQPASGFGAFGNESNSASSPFVNLKYPSTKTTRAIDPSVNTSIFGGPSGSGNAGTIFGAPSALGGIRPMFGSSGSSTTVQSGASSGGFGAYSGTSGGFGALVGQRKSFGELLKEGDIPQPQTSLNTLPPPKSNENDKFLPSSTGKSTFVATPIEISGKAQKSSVMITSSDVQLDAPPSVQPDNNAEEDLPLVCGQQPSEQVNSCGPPLRLTMEEDLNDIGPIPTATFTLGTSSFTAPGVDDPSFGASSPSSDRIAFKGGQADKNDEDNEIDDAHCFLSENSSDAPEDFSGDEQSDEADKRPYGPHLGEVSNSSSLAIPQQKSLSRTHTPTFSAAVPFVSPTPNKLMPRNHAGSPTWPVASATPAGSPAKQKNINPDPISDVPTASLVPETTLDGQNIQSVSSPSRASTFVPGDDKELPSPNLPAALFGSRPSPPGLAHLNPPQWGMQEECSYLVSRLDGELEDLRILAQEAGKRRTELGKFVGNFRRTTDHLKSDLRQFGHVNRPVDIDISQLTNQKAEQSHSIVELQGLLLKAETRKEEILQFNTAKTNAGFDKMLKVRELSPEHLEAQSQLKKDIETIRDRTQMLEDYIKTSKTKLSQMKTGEPSFRSPSLVTINRTYRNVDIAIEQQAREVVDLSSRMAKFDWTLNNTTTHDTDLPGIDLAIDITPRIAATTAAALNAERVTQKLKLALSSRKEPSLNMKVASAFTFEITRQNTITHGLLGSDLSSLRPSLPQANLLSQSSLPKRRKAGGGGVKHHSKPILLKSNLAVASTPTPSFDWGPLPSITPMTTISVDVRTKHDSCT